MLRYLLTLVVVAWFAVAVGVMLGTTAYLGHLGAHRIPAGLSVAGLQVGGMDVQELKDWVNAYREQWQQQTVTLIYPSQDGVRQTWELPVEALGITMDTEAMVAQAISVGRNGHILARVQQLVQARRYGVDIGPVVTWDHEQRQAFLAELQRRVEWESVPPRYDYRRKQVIPGRQGQTLDREATWRRVIQALRSGSAEIAVAVVKGSDSHVWELSAEDFAVEMARFSTPLGGSGPGRVNNIKLAARLLDGRILFPNTVLSFNQVVGRRTEDRGFQPAPEIVNQELIEGIGGGVCQVSSTLYNAVLLSGLAIVERRNHSRPLGYVPLGRDATVYDGVIDLQFKNPFPFPIAIAAGVDQWKIWVSVLGKELPYRSVSIVGRELNVIERKTKYVSEDGKEWESLPPGMIPVETIDEGRDGYIVTVYRTLESDEGSINERISRDYYPAAPRVIAIAPVASEMAEMKETQESRQD